MFNMPPGVETCVTTRDKTTIGLPPELKDRLQEYKFDARVETYAEAIEDLLDAQVENAPLEG